MCMNDRLHLAASHPELKDEGYHVPQNDHRMTKEHHHMKQMPKSVPTVVILCAAMVSSAAVTLFSLYFPFWLAPEAATKTYNLAFYEYIHPELHHFDTTAWTYGTDYGLAAVMIYFSWTLLQQRNRQHVTVECGSARLCQYIWGLLLGYAASTIAGALAHQFYLVREQRNSWHFRLLWTICVGTVTYASTPMGSIATEIAQQFQPHTTVVRFPQIPRLFWQVHGIVTTMVCAFGWFSYQRPACDIFIAGITQFPSSFYVMVTMYQMSRDPAMAAFVRPRTLWVGIFSFIANAPLLPLYPLLVQYTDWSLAKVNTLLHAWLLLTWSLQAISLHGMQKAVAALHQTPHPAVPMVVPHVVVADDDDNNNNMRHAKKDS